MVNNGENHQPDIYGNMIFLWLMMINMMIKQWNIDLVSYGKIHHAING